MRFSFVATRESISKVGYVVFEIRTLKDEHFCPKLFDYIMMNKKYNKQRE